MVGGDREWWDSLRSAPPYTLGPSYTHGRPYTLGMFYSPRTSLIA
jgi:hypothetical protein